MSWVKDANKIGRYKDTYRGFRVYVTKESQIVETFFERDGSTYRRTDFIPGELVAIDRHGVTFTRPYYDHLAFDIDIELLNRYYDKREARYK